MARGLQIWDASGALLVDTSTWMSQVLGNFTLAAPHNAGSLNVPALSKGRPYVIVLPQEGNLGAEPAGNPVANTVTISGTTINWSASPYAAQVIYGIY